MLVQSVAVVLRGGKGCKGRISKHCCSVDRAVERGCMVAKAMSLFQLLEASHTHTQVFCLVPASW